MSTSRIAHRMRSSGLSRAADEPSVSSFIDGLSPHPSVHTPSFLSSSPPPTIQGLERHPDAPKPFSSSLFLDHSRPTAEAWLDESSQFTASSSSPSSSVDASRLSAGVGRFGSRARLSQTQSASNAFPESISDIRTSSSFSTSSSCSASSATDSDISYPSFLADPTPSALDASNLHDATFVVPGSPQPLNLVIPSEGRLVSIDDDEIDTRKPCVASAPPPSYSSALADFSQFVGDSISKLPSPTSISRILMDYFRGLGQEAR